MRGAHEGGVSPARLQPASALQPGTRVQEFEIRSVIGEGGFGIVYRAFDTSLGREVAIKEYLPVCHALRREDGAVVARSERDGQLFHKGLRCFVAEARMLARFKHPALVEVLRFWEDNGTAYMSMPLYRGRNLREMVHDGFRLRDERQLLEFLSPLLEGLALLHDAECFHRDISTDNIMMLDSGQPVLLDFGAARTLLTGETDASTVILKPGFAPIEQYSNDRELAPQGAWSDIYALCAVVYHLISGKMPLISIARVVRDPLVSLRTMAPDGFRASVLAAIDRGLAVDPQQRPRDIAAFEALLRTKPEPEPERAPAPEPASAPRTPVADAPANLRLVISPAKGEPPSEATQSPPTRPPSDPGTAQPGAASGSDTANETDDTAASPFVPSPPVEQAGSNRLVLVLAGIAAVALVIGALALIGPTPQAPPEDIATAVKVPPQPLHPPQDSEPVAMPFGFTPGAPAGVDSSAVTAGADPSGAPRPREHTPSAPSEVSVPAVSDVSAPAPSASTSAPTNAPIHAPSADAPPSAYDAAAGAPIAPPPAGIDALPDVQTAVQETAAPAPVADRGEIVVSVHPWGNVYLNGTLIGVAPPRVRIPAPTGLNEIEIRNETHPPHRVSLTVEPGGEHRISHDFMRE